MTRASWDTKAGSLSISGTQAQLAEHLRLAAEYAHMASHYFNEQNDTIKGDGYQKVALMLERTVSLITNLAISSIRQ